MEQYRYDWARQELECVRMELNMLNHLQYCGMQFFSNEITAIDNLQIGLLSRGPLPLETKETVYWLAAQLEWTRQHTTYGDKLLCVSATVAAVCNVMGGCRSEWMAAAPNWTIYGD